MKDPSNNASCDIWLLTRKVKGYVIIHSTHQAVWCSGQKCRRFASSNRGRTLNVLIGYASFSKLPPVKHRNNTSAQSFTIYLSPFNLQLTWLIQLLGADSFVKYSTKWRSCSAWEGELENTNKKSTVAYLMSVVHLRLKDATWTMKFKLEVFGAKYDLCERV